MNIVLKSFITIFVILLLSNCQTDYEKMESRELAKGIRNDSIFYGLYFGMPREKFFAHCWDLNQKGILRGDTKVHVLIDTTLTHNPLDMEFYPDFHETKIYQMPINFQYTNWAIWNPSTHADTVLVDVLNIMERWYGKGFIKIQHPEKGDLWAKVEGNRRIVIRKKDERSVGVNISDLTVAKKLEKK